jgi:hypothetical protein
MPSMLPRIIIVDPFVVPPTPTEQKALTPEQVLLSAGARGMLPEGLNQFLANPDQEYYFQNDHGKTCLTRYTPPTGPPSAAQLEQRERMREARAAWRTLSQVQKDFYTQAKGAHDRALPGYQFFISEFLKGRI